MGCRLWARSRVHAAFGCAYRLSPIAYSHLGEQCQFGRSSVISASSMVASLFQIREFGDASEEGVTGSRSEFGAFFSDS